MEIKLKHFTILISKNNLFPAMRIVHLTQSVPAITQPFTPNFRAMSPRPLKIGILFLRERNNIATLIKIEMVSFLSKIQ